MRGRLCVSAAEAGALYRGFDSVGVQYGPAYRTLEQVWGCGGSAAAARLRTRALQRGLQVHPADLDDALGLEGVLSSDGDGETRLPFAVDDALLHGRGGDGELWAVRLAPCVWVAVSCLRVRDGALTAARLACAAAGCGTGAWR